MITTDDAIGLLTHLPLALALQLAPIVARELDRSGVVTFEGSVYLDRVAPTYHRRLLKLAELRTAQVLKISELARDAKLAAATAGRYLSLLEASFVVSRLPPFLVNEATRLIKAPKLFVSDAGLAAHLAAMAMHTLRTGIPTFASVFEAMSFTGWLVVGTALVLAGVWLLARWRA
jgi:hypothetical protein